MCSCKQTVNIQGFSPTVNAWCIPMDGDIHILFFLFTIFVCLFPTPEGEDHKQRGELSETNFVHLLCFLSSPSLSPPTISLQWQWSSINWWCYKQQLILSRLAPNRSDEALRTSFIWCHRVSHPVSSSSGFELTNAGVILLTYALYFFLSLTVICAEIKHNIRCSLKGWVQ